MLTVMMGKPGDWQPSAFDTALMAVLKGALREHGYSVERMAATIGITETTLGRYLRGQREMGVGAFPAQRPA